MIVSNIDESTLLEKQKQNWCKRTSLVCLLRVRCLMVLMFHSQCYESLRQNRLTAYDFAVVSAYSPRKIRKQHYG
jgi:hypothetical protein